MTQVLKTIFTRLFLGGSTPPAPLGPPVPSTYTPAAEPPHQAGQLWMRPPGPEPRPIDYFGQGPYPEPFRLAVDCYPSRTQGARNDNKLVLGPAGSGRSIMLARLTEQAHEAGHNVVALTYSDLGPVAAVSERLGGRGISFTTLEQATFNPFWFPPAALGTSTGPDEAQLEKLASLLLSLFQLTNQYFVPVGGDGTPLPLQELLIQELRDCYRTEPWNVLSGHTQEWYDFDSFHDFATYGGGEMMGKGAGYVEFIRWLDIVGLPFYSTKALGTLLNASPEQVTALMESPNRFLHCGLSLNAIAKTPVDHEHFTSWQWGHEAAEAEVRVLLLLLHAASVHLSGPTQRLTVVLDELHYSLVGPQFAAYIAYYLATGEQQNHDLLVAWHENPDRVFCEQNPGALAILAGCDTQVLTENRTSFDIGKLRYHDCLRMSEDTQELFHSLVSYPSHERQVLVRIPATGTGEVFVGLLPEGWVSAYRTKREQAIYDRPQRDLA